MKTYHIELKKVEKPWKDCSGHPVPLTDETIQERVDKVIGRMKERGLKQLVVYGDVEHAGNFQYLTGYFTRFEEGLLIVHEDGQMTLVLGNENLNKASKARIQANAVHCPAFSLPNQPQTVKKGFNEILREAGLKSGVATGLVGWKMFTGVAENRKKLFDFPAFILDGIREVAGGEEFLTNECDLFIGEGGARTTNNANEIAHYEYGAALASDGILDAMEKLEPGVTEMELGAAMVKAGQRTSVVTIAASGPRFEKANMFPTNNTVKVGDPISLTVGYAGGLSSRAGYAVSCEEELPEAVRDYRERIAAPYFAAYVHWLEEIRIGMTGGELYQKIEQILPKEKYGWSLCPGHLVAEEEWMSSPIYEGSEEALLSGMMLQIDIIPSLPGYGGVSAESTVVLADHELKEQICRNYPELWERMQKRRDYLIHVLGIRLSEDVLPMCSTVAYLRPYLLNKECAFVNV